MQQINLPFRVKSKSWFVVAIILYVVSTIGLTAGISTGLQLGEELITPGTTSVSMEVVWMISFLAAIAIQWIESEGIAHMDDGEHDDLDKLVLYVLLFVDFLALSVALGAHILVVWLFTVGGSPLEITLVCVSLLIKEVIAGLGAIYAEVAMGKAIESRSKRTPFGTGTMNRPPVQSSGHHDADRPVRPATMSPMRPGTTARPLSTAQPSSFRPQPRPVTPSSSFSRPEPTYRNLMSSHPASSSEVGDFGPVNYLPGTDECVEGDTCELNGHPQVFRQGRWVPRQ